MMEKTKHLDAVDNLPFKKKVKNNISDKGNVNDKFRNVKIISRPLKDKKDSCPFELVPPDGGWGWIVVFGSFFTMIISTLPIFGFSILFSPLLMKFDVSSTKIGWIFNICSFTFFICALFMGPLHEEYGWRKVTIVGGIINAMSIIISAFAPSPDFLFFSFSIIHGIGGSAATTTCVIVASRYFEKHRGLAIGIITLGLCLSSSISPLIASFLLQTYGYRGAALIYGSIVLHQCVGGALFHPVEWHMKPKPVEKSSDTENNVKEPLNQPSDDDVFRQILMMKRLRTAKTQSTGSVRSDVSLEHDMNLTPLYRSISQDITEDLEHPPKIFILKKIINSTYENLKTLKYLRVILISVGSGSLLLGFANFQMWIPFVVTNAGYSLGTAAWCLSAASIANIGGRIVTSFLSDKKGFNIQYANLFGILLVGSSIFAFSVVDDLKFLLIFMCTWGLGVGISMCLNSTIMISIMGVDLFPAVFGVASLFNGVFGIVFGPIVGIIRDATESYMYAQWVLSFAVMVSFVLWLLMPVATEYDRRRARVHGHQSPSP